MSNNTRKIGRLKRLEIFQRDDYTCRFCGRRSLLSDGGAHPNQDGGLLECRLTIDHLAPVYYASAGALWPNRNSNLVTCCEECNSKKGNQVPRGCCWVPLLDLFLGCDTKMQAGTTGRYSSTGPLTANLGRFMGGWEMP